VHEQHHTADDHDQELRLFEPVGGNCERRGGSNVRGSSRAGVVCLKRSGDADSGNGGISDGRKELIERQGVGKFWSARIINRRAEV
jgi:hypothetical protein